MSFQKAVNDIAALLTQGGIPANHSGDVAARLTQAMEGYYNYRQSLGDSQDFSNSDSSASSAAFRSAFRAPEEVPGGKAKNGRDGKGAFAWAVGPPGDAGQGGTDGNDGTGGGGNGGGNGGGGGGDVVIDIGRISCADLKKKLSGCRISTGGCDCAGSDCNPKCCPGYGGTGMLNGQSLCAVVDMHARYFKEIRDRLDKIEKILEDTVEC